VLKMPLRRCPKRVLMRPDWELLRRGTKKSREFQISGGNVREFRLLQSASRLEATAVQGRHEDIETISLGIGNKDPLAFGPKP